MISRPPGYSEKLMNLYHNPLNVGDMDKKDPDVGAGMVGSPDCGDVMEIYIRVRPAWEHVCEKCGKKWRDKTLIAKCGGCGWPVKGNLIEIIEDAKFKTFGCGAAIASTSLATEWIKGKTLEEALAIKNSDIVADLELPSVKIHCSVLAEDAIKAAIQNYHEKKNKK